MAENDYIGIRVVGRYQDQNIVNTLTYKITAQTLDDHNVLQAFAEQWETQHTANWLAYHGLAYEWIGLRAYSLSGANKRPGIVHVGTAGSLVGDPAPAYMCKTITLYTDSTKYRRRGRVMLSGGTLIQFNADDNSVTDATVTLLGIFGALLILPVVASGVTAVPGLVPSGADGWEQYQAALGRKTPSIIRSRRISGMLIG